MSKKHRFKPFFLFTKPTGHSLYKLNAIAALHQGYGESGLPVEDFAPEFYGAVGEVFAGKRLPKMKLKYLQIVGDVPWTE
ncbi:MAG: hypothetical protein GTN74_05110 [Proteobacteria bacterium]|nr:hypothetical protein [Pseudomonadota bacterium]